MNVKQTQVKDTEIAYSRTYHNKSLAQNDEQQPSLLARLFNNRGIKNRLLSALLARIV